jgi:hypothetical protein
MTIERATDTNIFLAYLDEVLGPALRIGDVVVMDTAYLPKQRSYL